MIAILAILVVAQSVLADISTLCEDVANHKNLPLLPEVKTYSWEMVSFRILGGMPARLKQYPWMALLLKHSSPRGQPSEICDGTIISNKYIITSAHCVHDIMNPADLKVRLGATHGTKTQYDGPSSKDPPVFPVMDFTVESITTHDLYNHEKSQNDVALVRVHGAITFNEYIGPAALPLPCSIAMSNFTLGNSYMRIMGWRSAGAKGCSLMKQAYMRQHYMCETWTEGTSKCIGSSPMPIIYWNRENKAAYLIGSISLQYACKFDERRILTLPGDLPSISPFLPWILDNLRE